MPQEIDPAPLAIAFFRSTVFDIILCEDELDEDALRQWEFILRGGEVRDYAITRRFLAFVEAKRRLRKAENISAYLLYKVSHGSFTHAGHNSAGPRCIGCSQPIEIPRREAMLRRIRGGMRFTDLRSPLDCMEFVYTHLTQEEMNLFLGRELSFSYQEAKIEEILEELSHAPLKRG
jgi:hypothetical protein